MLKDLIGGLLFGALAMGCSGEGNPEKLQQAEGQAERARVAAAQLESLTGVGTECQAYDQYTAALATLTVDCLGTIRPDDFKVNAEGLLARAFTTCASDASKLSPIDSLLSLQKRTAMLPNVRECFAGRYADFLRSFADSGVAQCPAWTKEQTVNAITASDIDAVIPALPALKALSASNALSDHTQVFQVPEVLEELNLYRASFNSAAAPHAGDDAGASAVKCAGGFAGFALGHDGDAVLTDPVAWLLDNTYSSAAADPFLRSGYYHPMSYYGGAPGTTFGNANRARPCPGCSPEICSYFAGSHLKTFLQLDCLDDNQWNTCVSYCGPKLP